MRLFLLCSDPAGLRAGEGPDWIRPAAHALVEGLSGVTRANLTALCAAGRYAHEHDWLLELELHPEGELASVLDAPAMREFVGDLRLLGAKPAVVVAGEPFALDSAG